MTPIDLAVNARFLTRSATGVDRVAIELVTALARRGDVRTITLIHPKAKTLHCEWISVLPKIVADKLHLYPAGCLQGHVWEQLVLPFIKRGTWLLSLCSTGPVFRSKQIVMIHDAQVWDCPESYSAAFRIGYRILLPILARTARKTLTVSQFSAKRLEALRIVPYGKAHVVLNGAEHIQRVDADHTVLERNGLRPKKYILALGSQAPHKNLGMLVKAAQRRRENCFPLVIAGGPGKGVFAKSGLSPNECTKLIGRVSDAELRALYEGASALAFPSLTEGFGLPPLEAMLCGCPVIATTGGAVPEVCGDAAIFANPSDENDWTDALTLITNSSRQREDLIARARNHASTFTWDKAANGLREIMCAQDC